MGRKERGGLLLRDVFSNCDRTAGSNTHPVSIFITVCMLNSLEAALFSPWPERKQNKTKEVTDDNF